MGVLESLSKLVAMGGDYKKARLSFQEYFNDWAKNRLNGADLFAALLGAHQVQTAMGTPAIGGKDSMSGSFGELHSATDADFFCGGNIPCRCGDNQRAQVHGVTVAIIHSTFGQKWGTGLNCGERCL